LSVAIARQLQEWHSRRALFDYFSFTTLTSLGYGDITPTRAPAYTLAWLEVMFGGFYMAIIVAQLVGMKLAQAIQPVDRGPR
jgi:voltage-gated potassium channel